MNTAPDQITFGPFFTKTHSHQSVQSQYRPLDVALEWSSARGAAHIKLFRKVVPYAIGYLRFEDIILHPDDCPISLEYPALQALKTKGATMLPLDCLLGALYGSWSVSQSVFRTLKELATAVRIQSRLTHPISATGLLSPVAEAIGFRLNSVFPSEDGIFCQIGWEPEGVQSRFHVCNAKFERLRSANGCQGSWIPQREVGICRELERELHSLVPGEPHVLLSESGLQFLNEVS